MLNQTQNAVPTGKRAFLSEGAFAGPPNELTVGIVVPVYNEGASLEYYLARLYEVSRGRCPAVVVDGESTDASGSIARRFFHTEISKGPNRGMQMNCGAQCLSTDVLLFLHADSELPRGFDFYIGRALADKDVVGGCFRLQFDVAHPLLKLYSWFTRFPGRFFHFGDQAFFLRADVFRRMGWFSPLPFLEDVDLLKKAQEVRQIRDSLGASANVGEKVHAARDTKAAAHECCPRDPV